ncbi:phosphotransferase family protein [Streptomyces sp. NPDC052396]|uniref:phosphotransferase family protein n=1 Tax=Streptomyces sp. NPDC052396 TaxID=3365689 RepID=UPI0037D3C0FA
MTPPVPVPTERTVRALARRALGGDGAGAVRPAGEGGEHSTWFIGERHVLRLALDADASGRQRREIALRERLRPRVGVTVPVSVASGEWADGCGYTLDTRLSGVSAELRRVSRRGEEDLMGMLRGLRELPMAAIGALGVPVRAPRSMAGLRRRAREAAVRLAADGEFGGAALPRPVAASGTGVLVHHDLKGEHLLVAAGGRVHGVLDWTDAVIGDPAEDIAGLTIAVGAAAAVRVAAAAGYGPALCARGLALARCDTLVRLAGRLYGGDDSPLPLLRAQRDRAWAESAVS